MTEANYPGVDSIAGSCRNIWLTKMLPLGNTNLGVLFDFANDDKSDDGAIAMMSFDHNLVKTGAAGEHRTSCCAEKH